MENKAMFSLPIELMPIKSDEKFTTLDNRLFNILNRLLQHGDSLKPDDASREIYAIFPFDSVNERWEGAKDSCNYAEEFLWTLWNLTIKIMGQVSHRYPAQGHMIDFMKSLVELPKQNLQLSTGECTLWIDLPILGASMGENLDYFGENYKTKIKRWINISSFQARLLGSRLTGWINFAIWALRDASRPDQAALDCYVISAGEWIFHVGDFLFSQISDQELNERCTQLTRGGTLYSGKTGLSLERWKFWRSRALEVSKLVSVSINPVALDIAKKMLELEEKNTGLQG